MVCRLPHVEPGPSCQRSLPQAARVQGVLHHQLENVVPLLLELDLDLENVLPLLLVQLPAEQDHAYQRHSVRAAQWKQHALLVLLELAFQIPFPKPE